MNQFELVGTVDENHVLSISVPPEIQPGPIKVVLELPSDEEKDDWAAGVARIWMRDWSDPREDIYTLEDGEPVV